MKKLLLNVVRKYLPVPMAAMSLFVCVICVSVGTNLKAVETNGAWELGPFLRPDGVNPLITPNTNLVFDCPMNGRPTAWAALHTFNPAAVLKDDKVCVLFRAEDASGMMSIGGHTSRIGLAESEDGLHFTSQSAPVLFPAIDNQKTNEWTGGCEDPRVVETEDGTYVMMYTEFYRGEHTRMARLGVATSPDLVHWTKHGPVFEKLGGEFANHFCKSGAMLTCLMDGRLKAVKYHGKYLMYWGEGEIRLASSSDLINWIPGPVVLKTRPGKFDSGLVEAGPPAVLAKQGIVLLFNAKNAAQNGDASLPAGIYSAGQALFDLDHPAKLLQRTDVPFFKPEADFERTGQYGAGTTFLEGLVYFKNQWLLYYGCADSYVAVAMAKNNLQP
ncbi:MAG TPA: glycoside hydrolase family 130 protein [Verrucomicrobiae bacterium]